MFLDFLVFFGPPVIGALANQFLMVGRKRTAWLVAVVVAAAIAYEILAFRIPFRSLSTEVGIAIAGTLAIVLIVAAIPLENQSAGRRSRPQVYAHPSLVLVFALLPIVSFTTVGRVSQAQKIAGNFDGVVAQTYRSHNHNVPSIVVTQSDGTTATLEGVELPTWEQLVPGRSQLRKSAWSVYGELDGRVVRVVPQAKVLFLGPFPD
jgi:hypothetical protein